MTAIRIGILTACVALTASAASAQDPVKADPPAPKPELRGYLPFYWGQLGLTDEQKQQVYRINGDYAAQIEDLEQQIEQLKRKRDEERFKVLSPVQKDRLEAIIREKIGGK